MANSNSQPKKREVDAPEYPDFPDASTLLVSSKRQKSFLVRSARELLAGGVEHVVMSALGDAIPLCVQLQAALEEKRAATVVKVETDYHLCDDSNTGNQRLSSHGPQYIPAIRIFMKKHKEFKGSRISPGFVSFAPEGLKIDPIFEKKPLDKIVSVNAGNSDLTIGGSGINGAFACILQDCDQEVDKYEKLFKNLLTIALSENAGKPDEDIRSVQRGDVESIHQNVSTVICRICNPLRGKTPEGSTGAAFVVIFKDTFQPHNEANNMGMVYVVAPKGNQFDSKDSFLSAVRSTANNLMTALCDYNGMVKRAKSYGKRIMVCRVCLFSGGQNKHPDTTKMEVATAIFNGLADGYSHGPAPRLLFANDDLAFLKAWLEITGLDPLDTSVGD